MNANNVLAVPISHPLSRQAIAEARDEDRNYLRPCVHDQLTNARLRAQARIGILALVACPFRMKADDVAWPSARQIGKNTKRILVEYTLLRQRMIASRKEWRIHRPPTHD